MSPRSFSVLVSIAALLWIIDLAAAAPWPIVVGACAPAALYAFVIVVVQRRAHRSLAELALAFLWGAVGASFLSTTLNVLARQWIGDVAGGDHARTLTAVFVAPGIEEAAKVLGLLLLLVIRPASIRSPRDGIVYGALIGIGFVSTENVLYLGYAVLQGAEAGLARAVYVRGLLFGGTHAVFTACVGAGIGCARAMRLTDSDMRGRMTHAAWHAPAAVAVALGFIVAVAQHTVWNTAGAVLINNALCGAEVAGGACLDVPTAEALYGWAPLWSGVLLAPGCAALWIVGRGVRRQW